MNDDNVNLTHLAFEISQDATKANQCTQWDKFGGYEWSEILQSQPQLRKIADKNKAWPKLGSYDWQRLICKQPYFMNAYLKYRTQDMTADDWLQVLKSHPQFLDICPAAVVPPEDNAGWGKYFTFGNWLELLIKQPQLEDEVPWDMETFDKDKDEFIGAWLKLIAVHPHFAWRLDWTRAVNCLDGEVWKDLLRANRKYEKYCPWATLPAIEWWPLFKYCPQYFEKCRCASEVPARAWGYLLCQRPELSERFHGWSQLTDSEWAFILKRQPRLANKCPCLDKVEKLQEKEIDTPIDSPIGTVVPAIGTVVPAIGGFLTAFRSLFGGSCDMNMLEDYDFHQQRRASSQKEKELPSSIRSIFALYDN